MARGVAVHEVGAEHQPKSTGRGKGKADMGQQRAAFAALAALAAQQGQIPPDRNGIPAAVSPAILKLVVSATPRRRPLLGVVPTLTGASVHAAHLAQWSACRDVSVAATQRPHD
jgi:hypothetical protein